MNFSSKLLTGVCLLSSTLSCKEQHLSSDASELKTVIPDFEEKQQERPDV